jgi:hypothetical protein
MNTPKIPARLVVLVLLLLPAPLLADIVITVDGMVFNGKIIQHIKGVQVKLGNHHGVFTIRQDNIKEMHLTGDYREDMTIFKKMGRNVDENEVRANYQAGVAKIKNRGKESRAEYLLFASPFFNFNLGNIESILPYAWGAVVMADARFRTGSPAVSAGPRVEFQYLHSSRGIKSMEAFRFAAGPALAFPFETEKLTLNLTFSPELGGGYYGARGRDDREAGFKLNFFLDAGLEFVISSWVIAPMIRFEYVHDGEAPLMAVGLSLGAGYLFNHGKSSPEGANRKDR